VKFQHGPATVKFVFYLYTTVKYGKVDKTIQTESGDLPWRAMPYGPRGWVVLRSILF
jgi:hypothetical protein